MQALAAARLTSLVLWCPADQQPTSRPRARPGSLLAGIAAAAEGAPPGAPGYLLALDDDVALHAGTIGRLAEELERDESAFMATGAG